MEVGFFGLEIKPHKTYTQEVETTIRITNAALGDNVSSKNGRTTLNVTFEDNKFALCSLTPGVREQERLDLTFTVGETITFSTTGENSIFLTGNYLECDDGSDDDPEEALARLYGLADEHDEDESEEDEQMSDVDEDSVSENEQQEEEEEEEEDEEEKQSQKAVKAGNKRKTNGTVSSPGQSEPSGKKQKRDNVGAANVPKNAKAEIKEQAKEQQEQKVLKDPNEKKSKKSDEKSEKPSTKTLKNGLSITDTTVGSGPVAKPGRKVSVRYIGRLTNGKVFDKNTTGSPFSFQIGRGEVIKGWDTGIAGMRVGGTRKLLIPPVLAYGKRGAPPDIPGNATLDFEVKLLSVN